MESLMLSALRRPAALLATLLLLPMGGCTFFRSLIGNGFQRPTLTFESWAPEQLDLEGVTIGLHFRLDNPNDYALDLQRLDYRLEVENQQVAEGRLPGGVSLRAQGSTPVALPVRLRWRDVPNFIELLVTRSELAYRVTGTAGIGSLFGPLDLPFEHRDRIAVPRPSILLGSGS
jgi:hypothetical protein